MPLHIIREDITRMEVDAIVAAGSARPGTPMPTGGVNGSIHKKAGARLLEALRRLGGIRTGRATLTDAYDLPCKYVIHTAGPVWRGGSYGEEQLLRACYEEALQLADLQGFASIAFPLISSGRYGYPKEQALRIATSAIRAFLNAHDMDVYLVVYDRETFCISDALFTGVEQFIDQYYVDAHRSGRQRREWDWDALESANFAPDETSDSLAVTAPAEEKTTPAPAKMAMMAPMPAKAVPAPKKADAVVPPSLERRLQQLDEGFAGTLLQLIDDRGMKDSVCYRKANVDRKLFNKIKNTPGYTPKKSTVAAFCVALGLDIHTARDLMARAGYAMSRSNMFDVIVEYFLLMGIDDVDMVNQVLFAYDQPLLGSTMG